MTREICAPRACVAVRIITVQSRPLCQGLPASVSRRRVSRAGCFQSVPINARRKPCFVGSNDSRRRRAALVWKWPGTRCERADLAASRRGRMTRRPRCCSLHRSHRPRGRPLPQMRRPPGKMQSRQSGGSLRLLSRIPCSAADQCWRVILVPACRVVREPIIRGLPGNTNTTRPKCKMANCAFRLRSSSYGGTGRAKSYGGQAGSIRPAALCSDPLGISPPGIQSAYSRPKKFCRPLETPERFFNSVFATLVATRVPDGPGLRRAPVVSGALVTILLFGGFGYAHV
jgi:hypothetical protein